MRTTTLHSSRQRLFTHEPRIVPGSFRLKSTHYRNKVDSSKRSRDVPDSQGALAGVKILDLSRVLAVSNISFDGQVRSTSDRGLGTLLDPDIVRLRRRCNQNRRCRSRGLCLTKVVCSSCVDQSLKSESGRYSLLSNRRRERGLEERQRPNFKLLCGSQP
jgi:hypothetical protein